MLYFLLALVALVVLGSIVAPQRTGIILRYVYFLRVPIIFGPLFLLLLAYFGATTPNALQNALITDHPVQIFILAFEAAFLALLFIYYREQIWVHAQERFDAPPSPFPLPDRESGHWTASISEVGAVLVAAPLIAVVIKVNEVENWPLQSLAFLALLGVVLAHLAAVWIREQAADDLARLISGCLARLPKRLRARFGPGYFTHEDPPQFYRGHAKSTLLALFTFVLFMLSFVFLNPALRNSVENEFLLLIFNYCDEVITPAAYVLGVAMFLMTLFTGLSYFVDRYRIPLVTLLLVLTYIASGIQQRDHYFPVYLARPTDPAALNAEGRLELELEDESLARPPYVEPTSVTEAFANRLDLLEKSSPVPAPNTPAQSDPAQEPAAPARRPETIVVCASGGGIQAAAWTVEVLTGLDEITDGQFSRQVQLISATSGGSLGALYYLDSYNLRNGGNDLPGAESSPHPEYYEHLYRVRRAAAKSGLEEILWAYYQIDLPRSLGLLPWGNELHDRGWALEVCWREQLRELRAWREEQTGITELPPDAYTMNALGRYTAKGLLPPVVFNTTIVENGKQVAFSSASYPAREGRDSVLAGYTFHERFHPLPGSSLSEKQADRFLPDTYRSTAVRLSAAFPYISPVAQPSVQYGIDATGELLPGRRFEVPYMHLTDGGFFDNLGILAGIEWIRSIAEVPELRQRAGRIVILQLLDRESRPQAEAREFTDIRQVDGWKMALFGPLQTITNVRGTTQTSRTALEVGMLRQAYPDLDIEFIQLSPRSYAEDHVPPLSWKLSKKDLDKIQESWLLQLWENKQLQNFIQRLQGEA